jgi:alpha-tubulin suppressor-like RCC1 family protein
MQRSRVNEPTEITPFLPPHVRITNINCGAMFTLFITDENELYGCGINDLGQLGLDTYLEEMQVAAIERARQTHGVRKVVTSDVTVPSRVICFENMKVCSIACGENHSLAIVGEDKSLWAWGMFKNGQLGLGEVTLKMNPRPIQPLCNTNIHRLAAGSQHSLALLGDSTQLQNLSHSFYLNSDLLINPWHIDIRKICSEKVRDSLDEDES